MGEIVLNLKHLYYVLVWQRKAGITTGLLFETKVRGQILKHRTEVMVTV
jgi:hypothetical protein